jgi:hypothetical protein
VTVATFGIPYPVDGPAPQPPKYGLLAAAQIIPAEDERWANGVEVWPFPPDGVLGQVPCGAGSAGQKSTGGAVSRPTFAAFTAYLAATCNARGIATNDDFRARAVAAFAAVEGSAAEKQLASGAYEATSPYLTDLNLTAPGGGPLSLASTSPVNALALLEQAIARTQRGGLIHCDPATFTAWVAEHMISSPASGPVRYTEKGTPVAVGDGYVGAHPIGHTAPSACEGWAFATGPVAIRRSVDVTVYGDIAANLDRATNTLTFRAERDYIVYWDGVLQAGVLVDRGKTGCP